jgi:transcription termination factor Rho
MSNKTFYLSEISLLSDDALMEIIESDDNFHNLNINIDSKSSLEYWVIKKYLAEGHSIIVKGTLEITTDGFGLLRTHPKFISCPCDIYVKHIIIRKLRLKTGDTFSAYICPSKNGDKFLTIADANGVIEINGQPAHSYRRSLKFEELTPLYPKEQIKFEFLQGKNNNSLRIIDLIAPCGYGQRMLIVAPPRSGKTELLQSMAYSIKNTKKDCTLMILLVGERPEEVTEMINLVGEECVFSSTFDEAPARHIQIARTVIEQAKRLVENKKKVVILLDSITRLTRAYNAYLPSSGKVWSGGLDSNAIDEPKSLFGAARNTAEGGSLTIIATALVDTGSKMDEVIFEEFKGTGNSEVVLSRKIAEKSIFPAIDILKTGTRRDDYLFNPVEFNKITKIRKHLSSLSESEAISLLLNKITKTTTNKEFLDDIKL